MRFVSTIPLEKFKPNQDIDLNNEGNPSDEEIEDGIPENDNEMGQEEDEANSRRKVEHELEDDDDDEEQQFHAEEEEGNQFRNQQI